jgi:nucleotide-binding universal stress UspA family protein
VDEKTFRRILVALDASRSSEAALEAAASLARDLQAELHAMFVEDSDLLRLAGLPFAREVGLLATGPRTLNESGMQRALRSQARRAQQAIESVSRRYSIRWSFEVTQGQVLSGVLAGSERFDIVALGGRGATVPGEVHKLGSTVYGVLSRGQCSVLVLHEGGRLGSPVVLVVSEKAVSPRVLAMAQRLARQYGGALTVIATGADAEALQQDAEARLREHGDLDVRYRRVGDGDAAELVKVLKQEGCGLLVLDAASPLACQPALLEKLASLKTPLMIVR